MANETPLTKEAILDAAEQVLRRYGPDKTSVTDIAKFLQVSHGTLYRHFASKAALRETVTERWLDKSVSEPLEGIATATDGSAAVQLRSWLDALMQKKQMYALEDAEMFAMYSAVTLEAVDLIAAHVDHLVKQIAIIVERGMHSGEFKPGDAHATARAIFLATTKFHHPAFVREWSRKEIAQDFDAVWSLLLAGLQ
ncbi:TetR family transcriptional regulator [Paenibacillus sp. Leaf72]|uniref:TetR family transcriptional regulator n=1 Tax=Paenibacillus sp. Leaf72 TaxID=1736234 RepID=UPI0006F691F3|nr:TetR family transcriptional regulator [Paenibacillus sp. Leaf72]KQO15727.1 TetR family transcriptional regulator [Paenibacillus sp. Leaf72]